MFYSSLYQNESLILTNNKNNSTNFGQSYKYHMGGYIHIHTHILAMARLISISQLFFSSNTKPRQQQPFAAAQISDHPPPRLLSRRDTVLLSSSASASLLLTLTYSDPASAFSLGICTHTQFSLTLCFSILSPICDF